MFEMFTTSVLPFTSLFDSRRNAGASLKSNPINKPVAVDNFPTSDLLMVKNKDGNQCFSSAQAMYALGDYKRAIELYYFAAKFTASAPNVGRLAFLKLVEISKKGSRSATVYLAKCFWHGFGTAVNKKDAFPLFLQAARDNSCMAMVYTGESYLRGHGVDVDYGLAHQWLYLAAKANTSHPYGSVRALELLEELSLLKPTDENLAKSLADCYENDYGKNVSSEGEAAVRKELISLLQELHDATDKPMPVYGFYFFGLGYHDGEPDGFEKIQSLTKYALHHPTYQSLMSAYVQVKQIVADKVDVPERYRHPYVGVRYVTLNYLIDSGPDIAALRRGGKEMTLAEEMPAIQQTASHLRRR